MNIANILKTTLKTTPRIIMKTTLKNVKNTLKSLINHIITSPPPPTKLRRLAIATVAVCAIFTGTAHASCEDGETVIKFSHVVSATKHPKGEAAAYFAELVNKRMNGRARVQVFPDSILYDDNESPEALLAGEVQMIAPTFSKLERYTLKLLLFDLPFLFKDGDSLLRFQSSHSGQKLLGSMEKMGLVGLGFLNNGLKQISADKPLLLPPAANGLTFRVQPSRVLVAQFNALGAHAKTMPFKEVYGALASQKVNGQENTWSNIYTKRFFEVQDGVTETNHGVLGYVLLVAKDFWNGLPQRERAELEQIIRKVTVERNNLSAQIDRQNLRNIIDAGGTVRMLTAAQRSAWRLAMRPVWAQFQDVIGVDLIAAAVASSEQ